MSRVETIGDCTLYLGDCRDILSTLGDIDCVVTDPPYGVGIGTRRDGGVHANEPCIVGEIKQNRASDRVLTAAHVALRDEALNLSTAPRALVFGSWRTPRPAGCRMRVVWDKGTIGMGGFGPWRPNDEEIYVVGTGWIDSKDTPTVIQCKQVSSQDREHPTPKPVDLMVRVLTWCQPEWSLVDPFMGGGTTGVAAAQMGRRFTGIEIDPKHFALSCRRIEEAYRQPRLFAEPVSKPVQESLI